MTYLLLSIASSTLIFVIFKGFQRYEVPNLPAIVVNYFTACALGLLLFRSEVPSLFLDGSPLPFAVALGILFITLFQVMARVTQTYSVAVAGISNKMALIFPVLLALIFYGEPVTLAKAGGILLALVAIWLINRSSTGAQGASATWKWPLILFVGSGVLDATFGYLARFYADLPEGAFSACIFGAAGSFGAIYLIASRKSIPAKALWAGMLLGVINFGSIYFLFRALRQGLTDTLVFPINHVSIVLLSALISHAVFRNRLAGPNWLGVACAVIAILLLAWTP